MARTNGHQPLDAATALDELVPGTDPLDCPACVAAGDSCDFHAGFAVGWDTCAAFVAHAIDTRDEGEGL